MAEEEAAHHLLNVLEERELDVDLDKILAAFEDEDKKRDVASWVNEYLNEDTLLTKEELELYQTLKRKGVLHQYENDEEPIRPILDHELLSAIDSLQSSTAAIEEQCKFLEAQRDALMALKALDKPNLSVEHMRNERRRRENQEKARLDVAVDDVSATITDQLADTQREVDAEKASLRAYVTERLASDDKILTALPGIVSKIVSEPKASEDERSVDQWCKAIISFRTAEIKKRVDTVYLTSLDNATSEDLSNMPKVELLERKEALQAELETLNSEIASVAEMVVEHELRRPINELKERKERERILARSAWLKYVLTTLEYMGKRLDTVGERAKDVEEFQQALAHISQAASQRIENPRLETSSPARRRATSAPKPAFTPAMRLKPTKPLDLPPGLADALRHAGISSNQDSLEALQETLITAQLERERKLQDHYASASSSTHESLAVRLGKADIDLRAILDALYSHTPFRQVNLTNPKSEDEIKRTEKEIERANTDVLEAEGNEISLNDPKVRDFIARYGTKK
ncbi:hypothetical protein CC78DRAFT_568595 [Lojkania enalia]|uniref:Uncharacterized protein n=1 Tax=Lojkania enalia TaxID=147567 RepID=A0A9P4KAH8_9PLEO|nr:hypothetical protein CC78DRAFT_568595 [Didymosphaeria enalia]